MKLRWRTQGATLERSYKPFHKCKYIWCLCGVFSIKVTMHAVVYDVPIQFWPTLFKSRRQKHVHRSIQKEVPTWWEHLIRRFFTDCSGQQTLGSSLAVPPLLSLALPRLSPFFFSPFLLQASLARCLQRTLFAMHVFATHLHVVCNAHVAVTHNCRAALGINIYI